MRMKETGTGVVVMSAENEERVYGILQTLVYFYRVLDHPRLSIFHTRRRPCFTLSDDIATSIPWLCSTLSSIGAFLHHPSGVLGVLSFLSYRDPWTAVHILRMARCTMNALRVLHLGLGLFSASAGLDGSFYAKCGS